MRKVEKQALLDKLSELAYEIKENVPWVGHGGCGILAHTVGRALERIGLPVEVVTPADWQAEIPAEVREIVGEERADPESWDDAGLQRSHLVVRFKIGRKVYTWDEEGIADWDCVGPYRTIARFGEGLKLDEVEAMCEPQVGWNRTFDRRYVPVIQGAVNDFLGGQDE